MWFGSTVYLDALDEARRHDNGTESVGSIAMSSWTAWLPEWAFKTSLDYSLRGLRRDMLAEYQRRRGGDARP